MALAPAAFVTWPHHSVPSEIPLQSQTPAAPPHMAHHVQFSQASRQASPSSNPAISLQGPNQGTYSSEILARISYLEARIEKLEAYYGVTVGSENQDSCQGHKQVIPAEIQENDTAQKKPKATVMKLRHKIQKGETETEKAARKLECRRELKKIEKEQRETRSPNKRFFGPVEEKKKNALTDLADALGLPASGSKDDLIHRIKRHFKKVPELRRDPRYSGLFLSTVVSSPSHPSLDTPG